MRISMRSSVNSISRSPRPAPRRAIIRDHASTFFALLLLPLMASGESGVVRPAGLQQIFDGAMLPDVAVASFSHTEGLLPVRVVHRGAVTQALPLRPRPFPEIHF